MMLKRDFYLRDVNTVAIELLGKILVHESKEGITSGMIAETEAYSGLTDRAAHSYPCKRTKRTEIQFGPGGCAYVYFIYGMHCCFNVVANIQNKPEAVLIRALQPVDGIDLMRRRRNTEKIPELANGPGKLCSAMDITKECYGEDLCGKKLFILEGKNIPPSEIIVSKRINVDYAEEDADLLWRYFIKNNKFVSKVPKRYYSNKILSDI